MFPSSFSLSFHSTQLHDSWDIFFLSHFCKHSCSNIARLMETRNKLKEKSVDFGNEKNTARLKIGEEPRVYNTSGFKERQIFKEEQMVNYLKATENKSWVKH